MCKCRTDLVTDDLPTKSYNDFVRPRSGISRLEISIAVLLGLALIPLLLIIFARMQNQVDRGNCLSQLKMIGTLTEIYRKNFGGLNSQYPTETGAQFHLKLISTVSELNDNAIFQCPSEGKYSASGTDYRGPMKDANTLRAAEPLAGDRLVLQRHFPAGSGPGNGGP